MRLNAHAIAAANRYAKETRYTSALAEQCAQWGFVDGTECDYSGYYVPSRGAKTGISGVVRFWNVIVDRLTPLWNALCWLGDEDYPLTGDRMHTRWCLGIWYEVRVPFGCVR